MTERLWAPWRLEYVTDGSGDEEGRCIFCAALDAADEDALVVNRERDAFVLLNRYPYASGHLMIAPTRHEGDLTGLTEREVLAVHRLAARGLTALAELYAPQGYNLGWNLGRVAGAGVLDHVHLHVVPRWSGDTNFMPVLADVKVLPEHLAATRDRLAGAWRSAGQSRPGHESKGGAAPGGES